MRLPFVIKYWILLPLIAYPIITSIADLIGEAAFPLLTEPERYRGGISIVTSVTTLIAGAVFCSKRLGGILADILPAIFFAAICIGTAIPAAHRWEQQQNLEKKMATKPSPDGKTPEEEQTREGQKNE